MSCAGVHSEVGNMRKILVLSCVHNEVEILIFKVERWDEQYIYKNRVAHPKQISESCIIIIIQNC